MTICLESLLLTSMKCRARSIMAKEDYDIVGDRGMDRSQMLTTTANKQNTSRNPNNLPVGTESILRIFCSISSPSILPPEDYGKGCHY